jgi:putative ABC transport system permease protein
MFTTAAQSLSQDLRWSLRSLRKRPAIAVVVILSIGLAIGATTAAFSVVNAFMLRSWNADGMDRVVRVREDFARPGEAPDVRGFTLANLGAWRRENTVFEGLAAGTGSSGVLMAEGRAERVAAGVVTANFFSVLGFRPILGRTFTDEEDSPDRRDAVVLGYGLWQSRFGGDTGVIGRPLSLNGRTRTIVGVMPRGIKHPYQSDLWVPLGYRDGGAAGAQVYAPARLKRGVTLERANAELDAMARRLAEANQGPGLPTGAQVTLLQPEMLGRLDRVLYLLAAAAVLVLLIATANVSNLLLAQGIEQQAEVSVRTALGASRGQLVRQFLTYSLMLSVVGGLVGVALTVWTVGPLVALSPLYGAGEFDIQPRLDWPTLAFTLVTTVIAGVVFGLVPAVRASQASPMAVLRESSRSRTLSAGSRRWLQGFVVAQVALAFVLLIAAGSMARGLLALHDESWGFDRRGALAFELSLPGYRYPEPARRVTATDDVLERLRVLPGVTAVGATTVAPLWAGTDATGFNLETGPAPNAQRALIAHRRTVTPGYFDATRMPIVAGRSFDARDAEGGVPVVIVSQSLAQRYWPGQNPIGKRVKEGPFEAPGQWREVVGVVGSLRENPGADIPEGDAWYLPYRQDVPMGQLTFVVRSSGIPSELVSQIRAAVTAVDRELAIADASTLDDRFDRFTATERLSTRLTLGLGGVGLFLAAIGIYGLLSFTLGRRLPEFGIRAALGARPSDVRRLIARDAVVLLGTGVVIGVGASFVMRPLMDTSMFPGADTDALVVVAAVVGLAVVTLLSSLRPALKAGRVDPVRAMQGG